MTSPLVRSRSLAFARQKGRCYYCDYPMWRDDIACFALLHRISVKQARRLQCTAEHLVARQDGGKEGISNMVAACVTCNRGRHRIKEVPSPEKYRAHVQKRISLNRWYFSRFPITRPGDDYPVRVHD
jgi:5-methylcytosine-specific restriction endonuclease McrA